MNFDCILGERRRAQALGHLRPQLAEVVGPKVGALPESPERVHNRFACSVVLGPLAGRKLPGLNALALGGEEVIRQAGDCYGLGLLAAGLPSQDVVPFLSVSLFSGFLVDPKTVKLTAAFFAP